MDSVVCARTVSHRTALTRAEICKYFIALHVPLHRKGPHTAPELHKAKGFFQGMDKDRNGQYNLTEFTETVVKLYHDEKGDASEA